jgi:cysteinyl-tRNA synthetase
LGGFFEAMNDDFNTPVAIKELESLVRTVDARPSPGKAMEVLEALELASGILGVDILGKQ